MSKQSVKKKAPKKGTIQYIRWGLTLQRFEKYLRKVGNNVVGLAQDSETCPIARFVIDGLGAAEAEIGGAVNQAAPAYATKGYEAGELVGLPSRKWAYKFVDTVDTVFENTDVTGKQAVRALEVARARREDEYGNLPALHEWQKDYIRNGKVATA